VRRSALHRLVGNRLYRHTLTGRLPPDLLTGVGQAWPGDEKRGAALAVGEVELAGETIRNPAPGGARAAPQLDRGKSRLA